MLAFGGIVKSNRLITIDTIELNSIDIECRHNYDQQELQMDTEPFENRIFINRKSYRIYQFPLQSIFKLTCYLKLKT